MTFSVVIPTHNRLHLLKDAIETVRRQSDGDWELVVFDNASADDIVGHVRSLDDRRIVYSRSEEFLPVTSSWNRAIDLASREYVIFLGDDDGLTPGYFSRLREVIARFSSPEVIYTAIYQFLHPGVAPWDRAGYVADLKNGFFFVGRDAPFLLSAEEVRTAVQGSLALRRNFTFNIQAFAFNRRLLARMQSDGPIFRSPFPDYYIANVALARSSSTVIVPFPMSIAGVSKASFGFTLFNDMEEKGAQILNAKLAADPRYSEVEHLLLPGPLYQTNYVLTMQHVARDVGELGRKGVAFGRYRRLQTFSVFAATGGRLSTERARELWRRLSAGEKLSAWLLAALIRVSGIMKVQFLVLHALRRLLGPYAFHPQQVICDRGNFSNVVQIYEAIESNGLPSKIAS